MIDPLTEALIAARAGGPKLSDSAETGLSRERVLMVQQQVADRLGPVGAFKVACPPDAPIVMAPIFASDIYPATASLDLPHDEPIGIELEYGFRLTAPLPDPQDSDFVEKLRESVELLPVVEIVRTRLADVEQASADLKMLDNQLNGGLVLGEPCRDWKEHDLTRATAYLRIGDEVLIDGTAQVPGGDAFASLALLCRAIGTHCGGLQVGQVVITGSLNGLPWRMPPFDVQARIEGLAEITFSL